MKVLLYQTSTCLPVRSIETVSQPVEPKPNGPQWLNELPLAGPFGWGTPKCLYSHERPSCPSSMSISPLFGHGEPVDQNAGQLAVRPFGPGGMYTSPCTNAFGPITASEEMTSAHWFSAVTPTPSP